MTVELLERVLVSRSLGVPMKLIAMDAGVSRQALWSYLRHMVDPPREVEALSDFQRELVNLGPVPRWRRPRVSVIDSMRGSANRLHFAELVLDLDDLCHHAVFSPPVTMATLASVRGCQDEEALKKAYQRIVRVLGEQGIGFTKRLVEGEGSPRLEFSLDRVRSFVAREVGPAERVLAEHKQRTGLNGRFRGTEKGDAKL